MDFKQSTIQDLLDSEREMVMHGAERFGDFYIKDKSELTRKDFAYDAIWSFERGGKWQGPAEE